MAIVKSVKLALANKKALPHSLDERLTAKSKLEFDKKEVESESRYRLHFFTYGHMGSGGCSEISFEDLAGTLFYKDAAQLRLLAHSIVHVRAKSPKMSVEEHIDIKFLEEVFLEGLRVRAVLVPENGGASKWSNNYFFNILLK
ncbi:hypothetical protein ACEZ3G_14675 [Maribacter algicola]|uniref:Uncharacterized protein n=1 Tax=Meishania litoralis TaxID=3434685 RepID=A0ACC7LLV1_9FLAO